MATYATNLTTFWLEGATTVTALGGGAAGLGNPETDFFIESSHCISKAAWTNAVKGFIIDALGTNFTVPTDGAVIAYAKYDAAGSLDIEANGGLRMVIGSGSGDYYRYYIGGKDTLSFDSWVAYTVDPNTATADGTTVGSPTGNERWVGLEAYLPTTAGPTKGNPIAMDAIRYGRCDLTYTGADCTFTGAEAWANATTRRLGLLVLRNGSYLMQGFHSFGLSGTSCTFSDSNKVLFWAASGNNNLSNNSVSTAFNRIEILNASTSVTWDNISISALGTRARGVFVHTAGTIAFTNCQFVDMDTFSLLAGSVITTTTFRRCNAITAPGSTLNGSSILNSTVGVNAAALVWNVATNPNGKLDSMTFTMGASASHAIDFGTAMTTSSITLTDCDFNGYGSTPDANDSTVRFLATSGAITLNLVNCRVNGAAATTGNFSVHDTAGVTVTVAISTTVTFAKMKDNSEVRVYETGTSTEIAGIENATAGTTDNRSFAWSAAPSTVVDYVIHNFNASGDDYKSIRVNGYTVPSAATTIDIQQVLDRNSVD